MKKPVIRLMEADGKGQKLIWYTSISIVASELGNAVTDMLDCFQEGVGPGDRARKG